MTQDQPINYLDQWSYLTDLLRYQAQAYETTHCLPLITVQCTRGRVRLIYDAGTLEGVVFPEPGFRDPIFDGMTFGPPSPCFFTEETRAKDAEPVLAPPRGPSTDHVRLYADVTEMADVARRLVGARGQVRELSLLRDSLLRKDKRMTERQGRIRPYRPWRLGGTPLPEVACWCGCGEKVKSRWPSEARRYKRGHLARYVSHMIRVERGELDRRQLSPRLLRRLRWTRCKLCSGFIPTTDPVGRPIEEEVGLGCWRERRHIPWPYTRIRRLHQAAYGYAYGISES